MFEIINNMGNSIEEYIAVYIFSVTDGKIIMVRALVFIYC